MGATVDKLNPTEKIAHLANGSEIKYEKCLLAIGGQPKSLPVIEQARYVIIRGLEYTELFKPGLIHM